MSGKPSWSETKNRSLPSGENCGLMCLPCANGENTLMRPVATSYVASCSGENLSVLKSVCGAAVGREGDRLAVGRPRRLDVGVAVVRQLSNRLGLEVEQVEIADAAGLAGERERVPVGRPRDVTDRADARQLDAPLDVRRLRVENRDLVGALGVHDERELARRPATSRRPN